MRSLALIRHNVILLALEPGPLLGRIGLPLILVTALKPLYTAALGDNGVTHAVSGMLVLFSMLGLSLVGASILTERFWHTFGRLRTTPATGIEILAGKAVPLGGVLLLQQATLVAYGAAVLGLPVRSPALLLVIGMSWCAALLAGGAVIATAVRSLGELGAVTDLGGMFLTVLGGALVPLTLMPGWLQAIAPVSPGYWAMSGITAALSGDAGRTLHSAGVLTLLALLLGSVASWRITRGWGRSRLL